MNRGHLETSTTRSQNIASFPKRKLKWKCRTFKKHKGIGIDRCHTELLLNVSMEMCYLFILNVKSRPSIKPCHYFSVLARNEKLRYCKNAHLTQWQMKVISLTCLYTRFLTVNFCLWFLYYDISQCYLYIRIKLVNIFLTHAHT